MAAPQESPYGSWKSPVTSDLIVAGSISIGQTALDSDDVYWIEQRPSEGGRNVIVRRTPDGQASDVTPPSFMCMEGTLPCTSLQITALITRISGGISGRTPNNA